MTDLSATQESTVLDNITSGGVYVSLHTADEGNEPDGTDEVSADDYSREELAEADITQSGSGPTQIENDVAVDWGETSNDWGDVTHAALWSDTDGNDGDPYTATVELSNGGETPSGVQVIIEEGNLTFSVD